MAGFNKFILTDLGTALLNRVIAEQKTLKFTKFEIGSGKQIDIKTSTQLIDKFHEFSVNETNVSVGGYTNIKGFFDNKNLTSEKLMSEIGVYAQIDDEVLTEILFSYSTSVGEGETIPNPVTAYFSRTLSVVNRTDDVTSVTFDVTVDKSRYDFNTLAELQAATWLDVGDKINLWGNGVLGDSKKSSKIITTENTGIALASGLFAKNHSDFIQDGGIIATGLDYRNDDNAIWGGEYGGYIQDTSVVKVVGKRYIDQFDKKAYECLVPSHENTITNYQACNVKDNLSKLNNLFNKENYILETATNSYGTSTKYIDGTLTFKPKITGTGISGTYPIEFTKLETITGTYSCHNGVIGVGADEVTYVYYADRSRSYTDTKKFRILGVKVLGAGEGNFNAQNELNLVLFIGRWK